MNAVWRCVILLVYTCFTTSVLAQQANFKIACIGNSVTYGYGLAEVGADSYPYLRLAHYRPIVETDNRAWDENILQQVNKLEYFSGSWAVATPETARDFSAIAYTFGAHSRSSSPAYVSRGYTGHPTRSDPH